MTTDDLVISFAAGIRTSFVEKHLPDDVPVVRVMSNVPVMVDEAMAWWRPDAPPRTSTSRSRRSCSGTSGKVLRLKESHLDAVTATSGSGPAYFFLLAEAMIEACILLGLSRDVATELIIQTMLGSAKMLRDTGKHPVELREMVTSPGGTTIAAIRHLEEAGVRAAFLNAIDAARSAAKSSRRAATTTRGGGAPPRGRTSTRDEARRRRMGRGDLQGCGAKDRQRKVKERQQRPPRSGRRAEGRQEAVTIGYTWRGDLHGRRGERASRRGIRDSAYSTRPSGTRARMCGEHSLGWVVART